MKGQKDKLDRELRIPSFMQRGRKEGMLPRAGRRKERRKGGDMHIHRSIDRPGSLPIRACSGTGRGVIQRILSALHVPSPFHSLRTGMYMHVFDGQTDRLVAVQIDEEKFDHLHAPIDLSFCSWTCSPKQVRQPAGQGDRGSRKEIKTEANTERERLPGIHWQSHKTNTHLGRQAEKS
mmetsp:Transcript_41250/g.81368  ORF Transcript_41250/g.81368 Transcript_41250/m.81368 type:complete len:178 (+) Transcript_41250:1396-1929(+)